MSQPLDRYPHIDAIRGIAALLVAWMHISEVFKHLVPETAADYWLYSIANDTGFGRIGVIAFFAVSGFVIPSSFKGQGWSDFKTFAIKRVFRIYPAFWLSILLATLPAWYLWGKEINGVQILANITMIPLTLGQESIQGLYWTLEVELLFYGLCSVLFLSNGLNNRNITLMVGILLAAFILSRNTIWLFLAIMFWGALVRAWHDKNDWHHFYFLGLLAVPGLLLIAMPLYGFYLEYKNALDDVHTRFIIAQWLGISLFLVITLVLRIKHRLPVFLGEISYSVYLFHPVVFYPVYWWAKHSEYSWVKALPLSAWLISLLLATVIFAYLTHRYVEKPAIRWGKHFSHNTAAKRSMTAH